MLTTILLKHLKAFKYLNRSRRANYFSQGPTYGNKVFLKVNLYTLFHCYEEVEGYPGSGRSISIEKVNIHSVFPAPQLICYETKICFAPIFLKVCRESSSTCPNSWVKVLFWWDVALHHPVSDHSVVHQSRHCDACCSMSAQMLFSFFWIYTFVFAHHINPLRWKKSHRTTELSHKVLCGS